MILNKLTKLVGTNIVRHRSYFAAILVALGCGVVPVGVAAVNAQALVPHAIKLNFGNLEEQGIALARDAAQLAQFEQYDLALPRARLAVQLAPQAYQTQAVLGSLYLRKEEYTKAIASLNTAHNLKKDNPAILFSLGSAHLRKGDYPKAIEKIKQGLVMAPKEPTAIFDLGNAYYMSKRYDEAVVEFTRVYEIEKKFWAATNNIGLVEYERGNPDKAVEKWEAAIKQAAEAEDKAAEPKLALAVAFYTKGDRDKGIKAAIEALKIDPRYGREAFLKENLWQDKLMTDTRTMFQNPALKDSLNQSELSTKRTPTRRSP
jgi:tetratricopeptide (TPR) repeat protein